MSLKQWLHRLLFAGAFLLVTADAQLALWGIPTVMVGMFLAYTISWELAHLWRANRGHTSDSFATSIALMLTGALFCFGRTDRAVAEIVSTKGQNFAYRSTAWTINELTLIALSLGVMMGVLVITAALISYIMQSWRERNWRILILGAVTSIIVGAVTGISFGLLCIMGPPNANPMLLAALIAGLGIATCNNGHATRGHEGNATASSEQCKVKKRRIITAIFTALGIVASALIAYLSSHRQYDAIIVSSLVLMGVIMRALITPWLRKHEISKPEIAPRIVVFNVGWYMQHFAALGITAAIAALIWCH